MIFWQNATVGGTDLTSPPAGVHEDVAAAERYRLPRRRAQALRARTLLRAALAETYAVPASVWRLEAGPHGAPVAAVGAGIRCFVSLAHSKDVIACAFAEDGPIGIDVEAVDTSRAIDGIAQAAFGPGECAAVARGGTEEFYRIWTRREAYAKATGRGFAGLVDGIDLPEVSARSGDCDRPGWRFAGWRLPCGYWLGFAGLLDREVEITVNAR
jgi:4'-phosphopantetheinyl transferase